jgi:hemoglobin
VSLPDPSRTHPWGPEPTPFAAIGGDAPLRDLVESFYDRIDRTAPALRAMLPRDDSVSRQKLYEFLSGWLGGPQLYTDKRGHPRLRMRHLPFPIGETDVLEWLRCMGEALDETGVDGRLRAFLDERFEVSARWMQNQ